MVRIGVRSQESGRVIDLSAAAAGILGMIHSGVAPVKVEVIDSRES
ncbi:MAG: hypothetical protein F6K39_13490 [Okeania sp. SIO3B3]|nr:hypothetical protein [Okeania sp. SIO3B3]